MRKFWRCVESGEPPRLFGVEPPKPRIEAVSIVDMSASNSSARGPSKWTCGCSWSLLYWGLLM